MTARPAYTWRAFLDDVREQRAWPGGYPRAFVMSDGETLCHDCAHGNAALIAKATRDGLSSGWKAVGCEVQWENDGTPDSCAHCGADIEVAYPMEAQS